MAEDYLTPQKLNHYTELFAHFDYYGIGYIHYTCIFDILTSMHIDVDQKSVLQLIEGTGNDNPDRVSLSQYLALIALMMENNELEEQIKTIFKIFDLDKNYTLDKEDIKKAFSEMDFKLAEEDLKELLDFTKKDQITFSDFRKMILRK